MKDLKHYIIITGMRFYSCHYRWVLHKMHHLISNLTPPMIFRILKNGIYVKALFIKKHQTKFHQNRTRNKEVKASLVMGRKSRNFRKIFLPGTPIFDFFRLFIVILKFYDERSWMALSHINRHLNRPPSPHQLKYSRKPTSNRVKLGHVIAHL